MLDEQQPRPDLAGSHLPMDLALVLPDLVVVAAQRGSATKPHASTSKPSMTSSCRKCTLTGWRFLLPDKSAEANAGEPIRPHDDGMTQQWPLAHSSSQPSDEFSASTGSLKLHLMVEQSTHSGESREWRMTRYPCRATSRAGAQLEAEQLAHDFQPEHPMIPQDRIVFRVNPEQYIVEVTGMASTFHFRITVVEEV